MYGRDSFWHSMIVISVFAVCLGVLIHQCEAYDSCVDRGGVPIRGICVSRDAVIK